MKKVSAIHALMIALMICLTLAIPLRASATAQAYPTKPSSESTTVSEPTSEPAEAPIVQSPEVAYVEDDEPAVEETSAPEEDTASPTEEASTSTEDVSLCATEEVAASEPTPPPCCDYCGSANHSYAHCAQRAVDNGANGRWVVPNAGINVACYWTTGHCSASEYEAALARAQAIVDAWDSATISDMSCGGLVIGDHSNQEFSALKYVYEGMEAYMDYGTYQQKYVCTRFEYGHNNETGGITDENYNRIYTDAGDILCYTCNGCWQNLIVAVFSPVYG